MALNKFDPYWSEGQEGMSFDDVELQFRNQESMNGIVLLSSRGLSECAQKNDDAENSQANLQSFDDDISVEEMFNNINLDNLPITEKSKFPSSTLSISQTAQNVILGLEYSFVNIKGLEEKIILLKYVIESHDGNAILTVVLFLRETLNKQIFLREISKFIDAIEVYMIYLEDNLELTELEDMFLVLDRSHDAAVWRFDNTVCSKYFDSKVNTIDMCLRTHFHINIVSNFLHESLCEFKELVKDQHVLEDIRIYLIEREHEAFLHFEANAKGRRLIYTSVLYFLILSILYCCKIKQMDFKCSTIQRKYSLTRKQFQWCAVRVFASTKEWQNLDDVISPKNWLKVTMKNVISYARIIDVLSKFNVPMEIIQNYILQLQDPDQKLQYAKKYNCHSIVIEIYKTNKDRLGLVNYSEIFEPHTVLYCTIQELLSNRQIKWRN